MKWFVLLNHPNGPMALESDDLGTIAFFDDAEAAREAVVDNPLANAYGYEVFRFDGVWRTL